MSGFALHLLEMRETIGQVLAIMEPWDAKLFRSCLQVPEGCAAALHDVLEADALACLERAHKAYIAFAEGATAEEVRAAYLEGLG